MHRFDLFINTNQTANITHKIMTFYLILKNFKYVKRQVGTQNKQKWIVHSKNIIIYKFMTYFYAEKFCFINFPIIPIHFFRPRPTFLIVYPPPHGFFFHIEWSKKLIKISHWRCYQDASKKLRNLFWRKIKIFKIQRNFNVFQRKLSASYYY